MPTKTKKETPQYGQAIAYPKRSPLPAALATPTDLTKDEVEAFTNAVNPLIFDAFALHIKTKNFHWYLLFAVGRREARGRPEEESVNRSRYGGVKYKRTHHPEHAMQYL